MTLDTLVIIIGAVLGASLVRSEVKAYRRRRATARVTIIDAEIHDPPAVPLLQRAHEDVEHH